ncbi:MAG: FAD-dependent oxidoreductase [Clostridiales Family XIII bacterium]|jgi:dihydrolipoamide dehydrogenase|nr:FAD-dependent oxidoreductase [Clostridiales Family XIII bacterium]
MQEYLFEPIASTPYAKTLSRQAGAPLSAFKPGKRPYLTGADITSCAKPEEMAPPENIPPIPPIIMHTDPVREPQTLVMPTAPPAAQTSVIFDPVVQTKNEKPEAPARPKVRYDFDIAVIGGGPAGYTAAVRAAELGAKVILFEKDEVGGTDLYRGRIPMKVYTKTADRLRQIRDAEKRGVTVPAETIDLKSSLAGKDKVVAALSDDMTGRLRDAGVIVLNTRAALKNEHEIISGVGVLSAEKVILCGGCQPVVPLLPGMNRRGVITSDKIFTLREAPKRLIVFGGGSIGCSVAEIFAAFGSKVVVIEKQPRMLPGADLEISKETSKRLFASGVRLFPGVSVLGVTDARGCLGIETERGCIECDMLFAATGRIPNLLSLGFMAGQIACEDGAIMVNDAMETGIPGIYAAGDIIIPSKRAAGVIETAKIAAENAANGATRQTVNLV